MRAFLTIFLLIISNVFMTLAWYGHLKFKDYPKLAQIGIFGVIMISWGLAFFEYCVQVPANRMGYKENGGPYNLVQLKTLQEAISLVVFMVFTLLVFKTERLAWNHLLGFGLIVMAVFVIFKKW